MTSSSSRSSNDLVHVFDLSLGSSHGTKLSLGKLSSSLLLRVSQQFNDSSFVRRVTGDFLDKGSNEFGSLRELTLLVGDLGGRFSLGDLVALVETNNNSYNHRVSTSSRFPVFS